MYLTQVQLCPCYWDLNNSITASEISKIYIYWETHGPDQIQWFLFKHQTYIYYSPVLCYQGQWELLYPFYENICWDNHLGSNCTMHRSRSFMHPLIPKYRFTCFVTTLIVWGQAQVYFKATMHCPYQNMLLVTVLNITTRLFKVSRFLLQHQRFYRAGPEEPNRGFVKSHT